MKSKHFGLFKPGILTGSICTNTHFDLSGFRNSVPCLRPQLQTLRCMSGLA